MLRRRFYYHLKPYLPWSLRMALRRWVARRKRAAHTDVWPINPATATPPDGWPGWPDGRKFAFVLTHDVEGADGLDRCRGLAELELSLGFRSSYNFIPEGTYTVPPALRTWLTEQGFEVGVHDLHHDGHLFASPESFQIRARRINDYLRTWQACGFRSGFMLHNLEWLHQLNILYDASTFDTDPFEPQPDDVGTIFPFWIPAAAPREAGDGRQETGGRRQEAGFGNPSPDHRPPTTAPLRGAGYVELPYTLPQDSTLFMLLREPTNAIWRDKVDWIAERGGMVLLNTHPDYLEYAERGGRSVRDHYVDLLEYVKSRYTGAFWPALPHAVARHVLASRQSATHPSSP